MISWDAFVEEFGPIVYRAAMRIVGQNADAEDVVQEVFLEVYRLWNHRPVRSWEGLLRVLATRRAIDRLRRRTIACAVSIHVAARDGDPVTSSIVKEMEAKLRSAIARLPPQQAAVFTLYHLENQTHQQIALLLEMTPHGVSQALFKARQSLESEFSWVLKNGE